LVEEIELFDNLHACDLCDTENKSRRIAVVKDLETNEIFRGAPDCMEIHFGFIFEDYKTSSQSLRILLEEMMQLLDYYNPDLKVSLSYVVANFQKLMSFESYANTEAKNILQAVEEQNMSGAENYLSDEMKKIQLLLNLQQLHKNEPERFYAIWVALKSHPLRKAISGDNWFLVDKINDNLDVITLNEFASLAKLLDKVRVKEVKLKNPLRPWDYQSEEDYLRKLREHFRNKVDLQSKPKKVYSPVKAKDKEYLGTFHERIRKLPEMLALGLDYPLKQPLENFQLPNYDLLCQYTNDRAEYAVSSQITAYDIGKGHKSEEEDKKNVVYLVVWIPDSYLQSYPSWFKYGRQKLETLELA
jgi:uncharacterized protein Usg